MVYSVKSFSKVKISRLRYDAKPLPDFADCKKAMTSRFFGKRFAFLIHYSESCFYCHFGIPSKHKKLLNHKNRSLCSVVLPL